jgi:hypothetical protein
VTNVVSRNNSAQRRGALAGLPCRGRKVRIVPSEFPVKCRSPLSLSRTPPAWSRRAVKALVGLEVHEPLYRRSFVLSVRSLGLAMARCKRAWNDSTWACSSCAAVWMNSGVAVWVNSCSIPSCYFQIATSVAMNWLPLESLKIRCRPSGLGIWSRRACAASW